MEADSSPSSASTTLKRARDGSAFAKWYITTIYVIFCIDLCLFIPIQVSITRAHFCSEECNKDVPVALISFHNCSLDAKIKMNLGIL